MLAKLLGILNSVQSRCIDKRKLSKSLGIVNSVLSGYIDKRKLSNYVQK